MHDHAPDRNDDNDNYNENAVIWTHVCVEFSSVITHIMLERVIKAAKL